MWRCVATGPGGQCVMTSGTTEMPEWCVPSSDTLGLVCAIVIFTGRIEMWKGKVTVREGGNYIWVIVVRTCHC